MGKGFKVGFEGVGRYARLPRCFINHDAGASDPDGFQPAILAVSGAMK